MNREDTGTRRVKKIKHLTVSFHAITLSIFSQSPSLGLPSCQPILTLDSNDLTEVTNPHDQRKHQ